MLTKDFQEKFPFLSVVKYGGNEYVGIIINQDQWVMSMYVYSKLKTEKDQLDFLELGEVWWWESNRLIPINIFLRNEMDKFRYSIVNMNTKDVTVMFGPSVNLNELYTKRVKRKNIQIIKNKR
jgi:hypothetical protein